MKIIAFSGKKQAGKTTAVEDIGKRFSEDDIWYLNFADYLKNIVAKCFCNSVSFCEENKDEYYYGKTGRRWLQIVGTDWFRKANEDCWVNAYQSTCEGTEDCLILTADVRFPNEVKCIQDLGGHVIRLLRNPHDDQHESETALDRMAAITMNQGEYTKQELDETTLFDAIIDNRDMSIEEQNEAIWKLVNEKGWL